MIRLQIAIKPLGELHQAGIYNPQIAYQYIILLKGLSQVEVVDISQ
jgi:hypothetical protein